MAGRPRRERRRPPREDDAGREDRPDDAGRAASSSRTPGDVDDATSWARCCTGGGSDPKAGNSLEAWTDLYDGVPERARCRRGSRSRSSTASTPCTATTTCWARRSSRTTSAWAARATPSSSRRSARVTAEEVRATGHPVDLRALRRRAARRALGPHVRRLRRRPRARARDLGAAAVRGLQGSEPRATRCACWPAPSTSSATAARPAAPAAGEQDAPARTRPARPGRHARSARPSCARIHLPRLRRRHRGRRGHDHALLQQLERREGLGQQAACSPTS